MLQFDGNIAETAVHGDKVSMLVACPSFCFIHSKSIVFMLYAFCKAYTCTPTCVCKLHSACSQTYPPKEGRFVERSGGIFVITISLTVVGTGLLTTSTHHTPTDLFITLPILLKPSKQLQRLHSVEFTINYVPYSLATGLPFGISYLPYVWRHAMSDLPLSFVACDIKHVRIHVKWHSITSNLRFKRFKPCEAWFKHVCSAVGHSSDNGFWHTVLFFKDT